MPEPAPRPGRRTRAAFFDIDGTLLSVNSARLFVAFMRREGLASRSDLLRAAYYLSLYKMGWLRPGDVLERSIDRIRGRSETWLIERCEPWYEREVRPFLVQRMCELIEEHRAAGDLLVLLSSSTCYLGDPLGEDLGIEHRLVNRLEVDPEGRFTGHFLRPVCYGRGKIAHAERFADEQGVDLDTSYFYTDSITDLPVLERVGEPRVVNPDPRLRREARRRGWPVVDLSGARSGPGAVTVEPAA